jgi:hypothetical protein
MYDDNVTIKTITTPYVEYGLNNGSMYDNETSFVEDFYQKVITSLLSTHNVQDVASLVPTWTIDPSITGNEKIVLQALWSAIIGPWATFNNAQLASFYVDYSGNSSTLSNNIVYFHSLINFQPYSKLLDAYLTTCTFDVNIKGRGYSQDEINSRSNDTVTAVNSDNISKSSLTDLIAYLTFENKVSLTYKFNNGLALTSPYGDALTAFQGYINQLISLFNEVQALVKNTLQVKV